MNTNIAEIIQNEANKLDRMKTDAMYLKPRKLEKIYRCYEIPSGEKIIAYCKTHPFGITTNGCVFTDKAFYPHPSFLTAPSKGDLAPMRMDYFDFDKYIILQADEKDYVFMLGKNKNYFICHYSASAKNSTSGAIRQMLQCVQNYVCGAFPHSKKNLQEIAQSFFDKISDEIKSDEISTMSSNLLRGMIFTNSFRNEAISLLFESTYRICDTKNYIALLNEYSKYINNEQDEYYRNIPKQFNDNFIADLSNPNLTFSDDYIYKIRCNITKSEETKENRLFYILASVRAGDIIFARNLINKLTADCGKEYVCIAEDFACVYGNRLMQKAVGELNSGNDLPKKLQNITDGLGLTPLHYAIMQNNKEAARRILLNKNFKIKDIDYPNEKINDLLCFSSTAYLQGADMLAVVISSTSAEMEKLYILRKKPEGQIEKAERMIETLERQSSKLNRQNNIEFVKDVFHGNLNLDDTPKQQQYYQTQEQIRENIQKLKDLRQNTKEKIEELKLQEKETYLAIVKTISQTVQNLKNDKMPITVLYLAIMTNDIKNVKFNFAKSSAGNTFISSEISEHLITKLLEIANGCSDFRMYDCNGFFFMLPDFIKLDMPYRKVRITENGINDNGVFADCEISPYPKYGSSWFSSNAHSDMSLLKKEYRELVKKYHPDVCKSDNASEIFASVKSEFDEICDS